MGLLIECPACKTRHGEKRASCSCGQNLKASRKIYWIDYWAEGIRKRRRIGPSRKAALKAMTQVKVQLAEGRYLDKRQDLDLTFTELCDWYLELDETKAKKSYERDGRSVRALKKYFKKTLVREILPSMIESYKMRRINQINSHGKKFKPASVNRELACLRHIFNQAVRDRLIEQSPMVGVKLLRENNVRDRILSEAEFKRLLENSVPYLRPIFLTAYYTGMRKGEIINLTWDRVDLDNGFIALRPQDTKTNEGRRVPLHPRVVEAFKGLERSAETGSVFLNFSGKPIKSFRGGFEGALARSGITGFTFHDFRHTAVTNWRRQGHDNFTIMKATGHRTMEVFRRYNTVDDSDLKKLVGKDSRQGGSEDGGDE